MTWKCRNIINYRIKKNIENIGVDKSFMSYLVGNNLEKKVFTSKKIKKNNIFAMKKGLFAQPFFRQQLGNSPTLMRSPVVFNLSNVEIGLKRTALLSGPILSELLHSSNCNSRTDLYSSLNLYFNRYNSHNNGFCSHLLVI